MAKVSKDDNLPSKLLKSVGNDYTQDAVVSFSESVLDNWSKSVQGKRKR